MGIKTTIKNSELPEPYQHYTLIPTTDGVMASVYLLGSDHVLKLFEKETPSRVVENETALLEKLRHLSVPKVIEHFQINRHEVLIYTQIEGKSVKNPNIRQIKEIGNFLKEFHCISKRISSSNERLFERERLRQLIEHTENITLKKYFSTIKCEPEDHGVIHGDLFVDNAKFMGNRLSGIYDFSDACNGDFYFELAVTALSWCYDKETPNYEKINTLLKSYQADISLCDFNEYIRYALLYYATTRYINKLDYQQLLKKLEKLS